jgi:hypothetical protein
LILWHNGTHRPPSVPHHKSTLSHTNTPHTHTHTHITQQHVPATPLDPLSFAATQR